MKIISIIDDPICHLYWYLIIEIIQIQIVKRGYEMIQ